ncbi:origin recognition complex domain-containing protein [Chloropicon primus]|uniref:Uncharacterized protein n=2 Tax=Chloropicon primus TaxID=1764295 RepID=A0A5B8MGS4_9CHLO|nr:hypothetical protein A3770_02p14030 [Chloropicon primus]UPQ98092.1 origin recognition complex domain-containing protein [Chloropicon primus]|eukprot:QDZ18885.1 hypothetical protein A3770_02p14030 [Chloropicon primus]
MSGGLLGGAGADGELEKAPAAVSVKVVRRAAGKASPLKRGRGINVSYGMRSRKRVAGRAQPSKGDIEVGERKTLGSHVSGTFAEGGGASYGVYRESWEKVEGQIDSLLRSLVEPVCDRTLEVARTVEASTSIPQLIPVIFHDAASLSSLDYSEYFRSTVSRFRAEGYGVVDLAPGDLATFRKSGVWSALLGLVSEQNEDLEGLDGGGGERSNSAVARRLLEGLHERTGSRIILAAESLEGLDKAALGEIFFALSEAWDSVPVTLVVGQFVKKEHIYSVIPKNLLTKMYPLSVSIPGGHKIVESLLQDILLLGSSDAALDTNFFLGPGLLRKACEISVEYQCNVSMLKRFLKSAYLGHVVRNPLYAPCAAGRGSMAPPKLLPQLRRRLGLGTGAPEEAVWRGYEGERSRLSASLHSFGVRVRMLDTAAGVLFNNKSAYLKILRAAASSVEPRKAGAKRRMWEDGSLFDGLRKGVLRAGRQKLVELAEAWGAHLGAARVRGLGASDLLADLAERLEYLVGRLKSPAAVEGRAPAAARKEVPAATPPQRPARGPGRRQALLQSHVRRLSDGPGGGSGLLPAQTACAELLVALCEVPGDQNPASCKVSDILLVGEAEGASETIAPSIPRDVMSSVRNPQDFLRYSGAKSTSGLLKDMEDASIVFHFVHGFSGTLPMEEVFEQFCGAVAGRIQASSPGGKRKRGSSRPKSSKGASRADETLNLRFERAVQELSLAGLLRINKRKLNKFLAPTFD